MAGHESAELELMSSAGVSIRLDVQARDLVESDRLWALPHRYAVNAAALVLEGADHWLTGERRRARRGATRVSSTRSARLTQVKPRAGDVIVQPALGARSGRR